jgi:hypothetical protein
MKSPVCVQASTPIHGASEGKRAVTRLGERERERERKREGVRMRMRTHRRAVMGEIGGER